MNLREDRRRTPVLHFVLLITSVLLCLVIVAQQQVISNQSELIRTLSHDSSQLTALKIKYISDHR
jgi:hypothetical protein